MELLKQRIIHESEIVSQDILRLDSILNQQVEPGLMMEIGKSFIEHFDNKPITKVVTIESSGIPVAFAVAAQLNVPLLFARKKKTVINDPDSYIERVPSFTKGMVTDIVISKLFLSKEDHVLIIDDIIANGDALKGLVRIIGEAGSNISGIGIVVEKAFQSGGSTLRELGYDVHSLVKIASLEGGRVNFID